MALFWHFLLLGCIAVGGLSTVMPDMYRYVVDEQGMVTARQFADLYALAQAAPGPNALWVTLLGLQAAGWTGAVATTLGALIPATVFSLIASALHAQHANAPLAPRATATSSPSRTTERWRPAVSLGTSASWRWRRAHGFVPTAAVPDP